MPIALTASKRAISMNMETGDPAALAVPAVTSELLWISISQEVQRDFAGMAACGIGIIGAQRRKLGAHKPDASVIGTARNGLIALLAATCHECPFTACKMKEWNITR